MAITVPSAATILAFWGDDATVAVDDERVPLMAQLAADLLWLATSMDSDPTDARWFRLEQAALMDLTIYLLVSRETPTENYTGMQGERIGSYSYSKAMARSAINGTTGAELFDRFVVNWNARGEGSLEDMPLVSSENVFSPSWIDQDRTEMLLHYPIPVQSVYGL